MVCSVSAVSKVVAFGSVLNFFKIDFIQEANLSAHVILLTIKV